MNFNERDDFEDLQNAVSELLAEKQERDKARGDRDKHYTPKIYEQAAWVKRSFDTFEHCAVKLAELAPAPQSEAHSYWAGAYALAHHQYLKDIQEFWRLTNRVSDPIREKALRSVRGFDHEAANGLADAMLTVIKPGAIRVHLHEKFKGNSAVEKLFKIVEAMGDAPV